jgi:hypothetical protein
MNAAQEPLSSLSRELAAIADDLGPVDLGPVGEIPAADAFTYVGEFIRQVHRLQRSQTSSIEAMGRELAHRLSASNGGGEETGADGDLRRLLHESQRALVEAYDLFTQIRRVMEEAQSDGRIEQLDLILRLWEDRLSGLGVTKIRADVGTPVDVRIHRIVEKQQVADQPSGRILSAVRDGFLSDERLIRVAEVVASA